MATSKSSYYIKRGEYPTSVYSLCICISRSDDAIPIVTFNVLVGQVSTQH